MALWWFVFLCLYRCMHISVTAGPWVLTTLFSLHSQHSRALLLFPRWLNCCISLIVHYICFVYVCEFMVGILTSLPQFAYFPLVFDFISRLPHFLFLFYLLVLHLWMSLCLSRLPPLSVVRLPFLKRQGQEEHIFSAHYRLCHWLLTGRAIVILSDPPLSKSPASFPLCWLWPKIPTTTTTSTAPSHALMPHRLSSQIPLIIIPETSVLSCLSRSLVASKGPNCLCSFSFIKTSWKVPAYA